jgi:hypothetical protein
MGFSFWIGIAVGGVVSLLASFAANFFHSRMVNFLDSRKLGFQKRRRKNAHRLHSTIESLHSGKRDKYLYVLWLLQNATFAFVLGLGALLTGLIIVVLGRTSPDSSISDLLADPVAKERFLGTTFLLFVSLSSFFTAMSSIWRVREIQKALDNFDEYEADFRKKWRDDGVELIAPS